MTAAETLEVSESLRALGIAVVDAEPTVDDDLPVVSWEDDLPGFLDAAKELSPAEAYVGPLTVDDDLVASLEDDDLDEAELESLRTILDDARALAGQPVGAQALFLADEMVHEYFSLTPAAHELFERIEEFAGSLADEACGCGHNHGDDHAQLLQISRPPASE